MTAEISCSVAPLTASGFPRETINLYPAMIIKIKAIPPASPKTMLKTDFTKLAGSVLIIPSAVSTERHFFVLSSNSLQGGGTAGICSSEDSDAFFVWSQDVSPSGGLVVKDNAIQFSQVLSCPSMSTQICRFSALLVSSRGTVIVKLEPEASDLPINL